MKVSSKRNSVLRRFSAMTIKLEVHVEELMWSTSLVDALSVVFHLLSDGVDFFSAEP
jgi:hypothetical protein